MAENNHLLEQIQQLEKEILEKKKRLVALKHNLPPQETEDFTFRSGNGSEISLSDLFGNRDELILIHNMGKQCPYCTLWADGFNSLLPHLENRAAFVVVSPDDPKTQKEFADGRGWRFRMVSYGDNDFAAEMKFLGENSKYWPGVSAFTKTSDGKIYRSAWSYFGPGDDFCSTWHLFDLLPKGADGWEPKYQY